MSRRLAASTALLLAFAACDSDFESRTEVSRPRVLAIVAEAPEVAPGVDVAVEAMVVDPEGRTLERRWSMCTTAESAGGFATGPPGGGGSEPSPDPGCDESSPFTTMLPTTDTGGTIVPGTCADPTEPWRCTSGIVALFSGIGAMGSLPPELIEQLIDTVGITLTVNLDVYLDGELAERAFKRIAITRRADVTTNPPAPRFRIGDQWVSARGVAEPFTCIPEDGVTPVLPALAEVALAPEPDEDWFETFPIVGLDGSQIEGDESAFYSWFSTGGSFEPELSTAPERDTLWTTPQEAGTRPLWVVVRDGHLGASACRIDVEVLPVVPPYGEVRRL